MSNRTLYYWKPGEKRVKLAFTSDDIPLLAKWYEDTFKTPHKPDFKDLPISILNMFAKSYSFAYYRFYYRLNELKQAIKNFFRWKNI